MILFFRQGGIAVYRFLIIWNCQLLLSLGIIVHFGVCNRSLCFLGIQFQAFHRLLQFSWSIFRLSFGGSIFFWTDPGTSK